MPKRPRLRDPFAHEIPVTAFVLTSAPPTAIPFNPA